MHQLECGMQRYLGDNSRQKGKEEDVSCTGKWI